MSQSLARRPDAAVVAIAVEPTLSPAVASVVSGIVGQIVGASAKPRDRWTDSDREAALVLAAPDLSRVSQADRHEAARAAQGFDAMLRPATLDEVLVFLKPINAGVRNPQPQDDFRAVAMAIAVLELPAAALSPTAQREGLRRWQFFPSAADVAALVEPLAAGWRRKRDDCQQVAAGPQQPAQASQAGQRTPEEIAHVSAQVKALKQHMAGMREEGRREAIQARPSAPHHLIAGYEKMIAEGSPMAAGARLRLAQLRREHGEGA